VTNALDDDNNPWIDRWPQHVDVPDVDDTVPDVWHLYGPDGEVLLTFSDRPSFGFHQGERGVPRRV